MSFQTWKGKKIDWFGRLNLRMLHEENSAVQWSSLRTWSLANGQLLNIRTLWYQIQRGHVMYNYISFHLLFYPSASLPKCHRARSLNSIRKICNNQYEMRVFRSANIVVKCQIENRHFLDQKVCICPLINIIMESNWKQRDVNKEMFWFSVADVTFRSFFFDIA